MAAPTPANTPAAAPAPNPLQKSLCDIFVPPPMKSSSVGWNGGSARGLSSGAVQLCFVCGHIRPRERHLFGDEQRGALRRAHRDFGMALQALGRDVLSGN